MFHVKHTDYDIIVVGGGHAGAEASLAAARMGMSTLLITLEKSAISRMSCNPAIGGLAKGHLVCEIDALGGEMAKVIDKTGIQFKMLNRSKGRAVWSPRAQADKIAYPEEMRRSIDSEENLSVLEDCATGVIIKGSIVAGVLTEKNSSISCKALIITCGTFLNGLIHIGLSHFSGGRMGERSAFRLTKSLAEIGIFSGRLKTGTPPRLKTSSIDFEKTEPQYGDEHPVPFSFQTTHFNPINVPCHITHTNPTTHSILFTGLDRSPLYTGVIKSIGPRYCPSIEDKIVRFKERSFHQIFLEPEWKDSDETYVNGFATSLPVDIQTTAIHSIPGLDNAEIIRPGYAIEYDYFPSCQLYRTLETKKIECLYIAGQVNGTSGYEEAAALGLIAGINASLKIRGDKPFILKRSEAYIGVLIDDLITKSPDEPYRMFTSSAEYRLLLRFNNSDIRLSPKGGEIGLLPKCFSSSSQSKRLISKEAFSFLKKTHLSPSEANSILSSLSENKVQSGISLFKILCRHNVNFSDIEKHLPSRILNKIKKYPHFEDQIETDVKYDGYINKQIRSINSLRKHEETIIPKNTDYLKISSITIEAREKLSKIRPETLGQASRIPGVSPADVTSLMILLKN